MIQQIGVTVACTLVVWVLYQTVYQVLHHQPGAF